MITSAAKYAVRNAELHRIVYGSANAPALELCKQANRRVIDLMCAFVAEGAEAGAFQARDARLAFRMVHHAADGLLDDLIAEGGDLDMGQVTATVLELAHRALGDAGYRAGG
ncbi:hypothetical protein [Streptomyces sclerotialus]|uniref:hypothetical protein n=1 Tax=Streptomyces sclerotialus TaxID=1957 RepID=UPI0004C805FB